MWWFLLQTEQMPHMYYNSYSCNDELVGRGDGVRSLVGVTDFSLLSNVQTGHGPHAASYLMGRKGKAIPVTGREGAYIVRRRGSNIF
jgi:hypothetical protein